MLAAMSWSSSCRSNMVTGLIHSGPDTLLGRQVCCPSSMLHLQPGMLMDATAGENILPEILVWERKVIGQEFHVNTQHLQMGRAFSLHCRWP